MIGKRTAIILFFILSAAALFANGLDPESQPELSFWYNLLGSDLQTVLSAAGSAGFGTEAVDIEPESIDSRADRILYFAGQHTGEEYPADEKLLRGLTVWFVNGRVRQLRLDSTVRGRLAGLGMGSSPAAVMHVCGSPWIEADGSLYYNLPWRGAPVRLRFVFTDSGLEEGLTEVYLYLVR